ncbi:MAG: methyltransferase domain-containing protein [Ktedonobacteraceae bacterium]|nr:methyltransferase domain-containing protein [Ktedonobacteraceae bacterium]
METNPQEQENTYVLNPEDATEMVRLSHQDHLLTRDLGGVFPGGPDLSAMRDILDIACGPGGWVLDVAHEYPKARVVGLDISRKMTSYARAQAQSQGLDNVRFFVMNALQPLKFPDNSFDLVNARLMCGFVPKDVWPSLLQECMRIVRPGGIIRLTETDGGGLSNSPAGETLDGMLARAVHLSGKGLSRTGKSLGLIPVLARLLHNAGCVNVQQRPHLINFSVGSESYEACYQNATVSYQLLKPFLIKMGITTPQEFDQLYQQMQIEMLSEDFCGMWLLLSAWGQKPAAATQGA